MNIGKLCIFVIAGLVIIGLVIGSFSWAIYKYYDCLKVGHTKIYCILDFGE